jgi:cellulose synthase/poly-beta-1,6-N-acetylglucosamine synthase-like glycosyltransferase
MRSFFLKYPELITRIFEIIFPLSTWLIITLPVWLSPFHPAMVAYFILGFNVYFFYKSFSTAILSTTSFIKLRQYSSINWNKLAKKLPNFTKIHHAIIIANYKENTEKVRATLQYLAKQDFPLKRIIIVLAMEEREGEEAKKRAKVLIKEFGNKFGQINVTFHPNIKGEVIGKASNSAWAARFLSSEIRRKKIDPDFVTVTSCDADSLIPSQYYSYLTYLFLNDKDRYFHFFWAPVLLYSNFWEVPLPIRLQATVSTIVRLAGLSRPDTLIQISTYSLSLNMLEKIGYWDTNIIPEDWHIFLQAFFTLGEKVKTIPIYLTISRDAVNGTSLLNTFKSRYEQEKRWAWGITDVPYAVHRFFTATEIPLLPRLFRVVYVTENHLLWPTSSFLLTLGASIPALVNPAFSRTALGYNLPKMSGLILTITMVFMIVLIIIDTKSRPKRPASFSVAKTPLLLFQWILLPIIQFFFSALPALDAHTRLMFGKRLEYKVTEKI